MSLQTRIGATSMSYIRVKKKTHLMHKISYTDEHLDIRLGATGRVFMMVQKNHLNV